MRWLRSKLLVIALLWLFALIFLAWALRYFQWDEVWQILQNLTLRQILTLAILNLSIMALLGARGWLFLSRQGYTVSYLSATRYRLLAFGISYFTPGPQFGGEPAQVYLLKARHGIPTSAAAAAVSLDKILELLVNIPFLLLGVFLILQDGFRLNIAPSGLLLVSCGSFALLLGYLIALGSGHNPIAWLTGRFSFSDFRLSKVAGLLKTTEEHISLFYRKQPRSMLIATGISLLIWMAMILEYWLILRFLGSQVSPFQATGALAAALIAFLIPLPGGLGALEASQILALGVLGFSPATAISAALLIRARDLMVGGLGLVWGGILVSNRRSVSPPSQPGVITITSEGG